LKRLWIFTAVWLAALAWAVVAAPLSGEWESTIKLAPSSLIFGDFITDISSKLTVGYTFAGWEFESKSTFNLDGYSLQEFNVSGKLGAFALASTLQFDGLVAESVTYALASGVSYQTQSVTGVTSTGASASWTKSIWNCATVDKTVTYGSAAFSSWQASAQTFLWGINFEGLFYLKGNDFEAKTVSSKWVYGNPYTHWSSVQTQTGSYTASACLPRYGSGWKLTLSGLAGDLPVTSRTYFNLEEYSYNDLMAQRYLKTYVADTFTLGGSYYLPRTGGETCQVGFTREFITVEGMSLGCAEFDVGLNITCEGFDWLKVLITDIELAPCVSFDMLITFETQSKSMTIEPNVRFGDTACFTVHLVLDYGGNVTGFSLDALKINGFSMSYTWNGITFASATSFNPVYESLGGYYLGPPVNSPTTYGFFVLDKNFAKTEFCIGTGCAAGTGSGYYMQVCYPEEYYVIWELYTIKTSGDGCCGGDYSWEVDFYFGDRKVLIADSFWFWYKDDEGNSYQYNSGSPAVVTAPTVTGSPPYCEDDDVNYGVAYYDADENALFGLVKTDVDVVIPISASFDLTFGTAINIYGWEKLELGFSFRW